MRACVRAREGTHGRLSMRSLWRLKPGKKPKTKLNWNRPVYKGRVRSTPRSFNLIEERVPSLILHIFFFIILSKSI